MADPFGDIPLFKELQKILSSGSGPVNLEIARQVANALNQDSLGASSNDVETKRILSEAVHEAEQVVSGYARIGFDEPTRIEVVSRSEWIGSTLEAWKWLLVHLARRLSGEVSRFASDQGIEAEGPPGEEGGEGLGENRGAAGAGDDLAPGTAGAGEMGVLGPVMGQIAPLLLGMQTGTLVGHLARESLGRYDPPIPREDAGRLFYVPANLDLTAADYGFERAPFLRWLALHDAARHLVVTVHPWVPRYWRSLLIELVESLEIDASDLERRLMDLQTRGPEALQEGMGGIEMLPIVPTERHRKARDRVTAFAAVLEGWADHVTSAVGGAQIGDALDRINEGMRRRRASPSEGAAMLQGLLGVTADRSWHQAGATFCAAVAELKGPQQVDQVWRAPDNLPTLDEIKDPFKWIERVLQEG